MAHDISPSLRYRDAKAAIEFLERAFGFERHVVYEDPSGAVQHAELRFGDDLVMLGNWKGEDDVLRPGHSGAYVVVDDFDAHLARAKAAGAEIVSGPQNEDYGAFYGARDLEGNHWSFGTYRPSLNGGSG
jgi:uncharacterized glyoxalase superfamily protein PhnB